MSMRIRPRRIQISYKDHPSLTEQCHKDDVSIQHIMRKFKKTGVLRHVNQYQGTYMDMTAALDYHEAQNLIAEANSIFETVPAHIRQEMDNDPTKFVDFMQNPENREKIEAFGLDSSHLPQEASEQPVQGDKPQMDIETLIDNKIKQAASQVPSE